MEHSFITDRLKAIAAATSIIEQQNNVVKSALCVLLGYIRADNDFTTPLQGGINTQYYKRNDMSEVLEFTDKEFSKMPKEFKKIFKTDGVRARVRKRVRGNSIDYEIRYRASGYNISASGVTLNEAKVKFIQKLQERKNGSATVAPDVPKTFDKFTIYYFENFRKRKVSPATLANDYKRLKKQLLPAFGSLPIKDITPPLCQKLIDELTAAGKGKTAEEVYSLLNCTFKIAIRHNLIQHNPMDIVICCKHERQHGKALTVNEEKYLLETAKEPFRTIFAIALYTGLRPNEYKSVRIDGQMIYANNSKRHNGKTEVKRIPITPMLRPFINDDMVMPIIGVGTIRNYFNGIFGNAHILYDLRTTFYTRCQMCNVAPAARDEFVGHSSGKLANTYTDLPDDYLIKEGQKLDY